MPYLVIDAFHMFWCLGKECIPHVARKYVKAILKLHHINFNSLKYNNQGLPSGTVHLAERVSRQSLGVGESWSVLTSSKFHEMRAKIWSKSWDRRGYARVWCGGIHAGWRLHDFHSPDTDATIYCWGTSLEEQFTHSYSGVFGSCTACARSGASLWGDSQVVWVVKKSKVRVVPITVIFFWTSSGAIVPSILALLWSLAVIQ